MSTVHTNYLAHRLALAALLAAPACYSPDEPSALAATTTLTTADAAGPDTTDPSDTTDAGTTADTTAGLPEYPELTPIRGVDLLFVVDNSQSMARAQGLLAQAGQSMLDALAGVDLRIAVTSTDVGNPRCPSTTPESGAFVLESCVEHPERFLYEGEDHFFEACAACYLADSELARRPTAIACDPSLAPRPWLERAADGATNLDPSVDLAAAFACAAPLGIDGCGFEAPLEAVRRVLARTATPGDPNFGFLRDDALFAVVILSDETDCSAQDDTIFTTDDTFWGGEPTPTSAACWRAGVACTGDPPELGACSPTDRDAAGDPAADPGAAVLVPVSAYIDELRALADARAARNPGQRTVIRLVTGVPQGYAAGSAEIPYVAAPEQAVVDHGVGPGCQADDGRTAVPPVRERVVAEAFTLPGARNLDSICAPEYDSVLTGLADELRLADGRACLPGCVADGDPTTVPVEPDCLFTRADAPPTDARALIPACHQDDSGAWVVPLDYEVCHVVHADLSPGCAARGHNAEVSLVSAVPGPLPDIRVACGESPAPQLDCPQLAP